MDSDRSPGTPTVVFARFAFSPEMFQAACLGRLQCTAMRCGPFRFEKACDCDSPSCSSFPLASVELLTDDTKAGSHSREKGQIQVSSLGFKYHLLPFRFREIARKKEKLQNKNPWFWLHQLVS